MAELPPWMGERAAKRRQNARSAQQERDRAQEVGGTVNAGSGSSWRRPQDVRNEDFLEQIKYTDRGSFSIKKVEWEQLRRDATNQGREPRMVIEIQGLRLVVYEE